MSDEKDRVLAKNSAESAPESPERSSMTDERGKLRKQSQGVDEQERKKQREQENEIRKDVAVAGLEAGAKGAVKGAKLGKVIPGAGMVAGGVLGGAAAASLAQSKVARESGNKKIAFQTAMGIGGPVGGAVNAHLAGKEQQKKERAESKAAPEQDGETQRRRRAQRQRAHQRQARVNRLEQMIQKTDPTSSRDIKKLNVAESKARPTSREEKNLDKMKEKAFGEQVVQGSQRDDATSAFMAGFAGGVTHIGKQKVAEKMAVRQAGKGLPQPKQLARGFGYDTPAQQEEWVSTREAGVSDGRANARQAVKERQNELAREREAALKDQEKPQVSYTPSIPIEELNDPDMALER